MSVPGQRRSSSQARRGRSHQALKKTTLNKCSKCGQAVQPHKACSFCGTYRGRQAVKIKVKAKKDKK
ncbi:MAG: 50S ribosomal protein L32 [Patescibacteria group bacterium]